MSTPQNSSVRNSLIWILPIFIMIIAVVLLVLTLGDKDNSAKEPDPTSTEQNTGGPTEPQEPASQEPREVSIEEYAAYLQENRAIDTSRRDTQELVNAGPVDAPVVLVIYSDYQCKFCSLWSQQTLPTLMDNYVAQGQLRIEWRDVNVFGENSRSASVAAHAAAVQGKFWEMHGALLPDGGTLAASELTPEKLTVLAGELGLDTEQFAADMASDAILGAVAKDEAEGQQLGITSTPTFLINGMHVSGAQPVEVFTAVIDAELDLEK